MATPQEIVRMSRLLEVEDLSFQLQLKDAVSILYVLLSVSSEDFSCLLPIPYKLFSVYRGLQIQA